MSSDIRELLELAECWSFAFYPNLSDGDSARIRSALLIDVNWHADGDVVCLSDIENVGIIHSEALTHHNGDRNAALRLATLKVAAEIGRAIKGSPRAKMVNF